MGEKTTIGWTDASCTPILARLKEPLELPGRETLPAGKLGYHCVHKDDSCRFCYSETFNRRGLPERGTGLPFTAASEPKVEIFLHRPTLEKVLRWQRPRRIFWCSMTDLFGEFVSSEIIQECLDVAVEAGEKRGHVSQLLTKRPERMLDEIGVWAERHGRPLPPCCWPGFSAGNRELFFQRWPFIRELSRQGFAAGPLWCSYEPAVATLVLPERGQYEISDWEDVAAEGLRWIVVGGESGNKARPFDLQWAWDVLRFLRPAGCKCFIKQVGRRPLDRFRLIWYRQSITGVAALPRGREARGLRCQRHARGRRWIDVGGLRPPGEGRRERPRGVRGLGERGGNRRRDASRALPPAPQGQEGRESGGMARRAPVAGVAGLTISATCAMMRVLKREGKAMETKCWECAKCGWQLLDPQLELATATCLCGIGAGRWAGNCTPRRAPRETERLGISFSPATERVPLRLVDHGHTAVLYRGNVRLLPVTLDGDSIEGRRSPEAGERVELLAKLASAWELRDVPVERAWSSEVEERRAILRGIIARRSDGTPRPLLEQLAKQEELAGELP